MYAKEQLVVPKSIAAMLLEGTRNPASFRGTGMATAHPLDVLRVFPRLAMDSGHESATAPSTAIRLRANSVNYLLKIIP